MGRSEDWSKFSLKKLKMVASDFIVPETSEGPMEQLKAPK